LLSQRKGKESLYNEIDVMKNLDHENLMKLHEIHESQNSVYLVLELLEGGELLDYIKAQQGRIKTSEYKHIIRSILRALRYMNTKNIMHRDLKPENMILKTKGGSIEENVLKIVDFGLATKCDIQEYLFKRCGTPGFVAPEVVNASSEENIHYTPKCDVFSAGVIFYLM
jgi:serine/threonine protein kinase